MWLWSLADQTALIAPLNQSNGSTIWPESGSTCRLSGYCSGTPACLLQTHRSGSRPDDGAGRWSLIPLTSDLYLCLQFWFGRKRVCVSVCVCLSLCICTSGICNVNYFLTFPEWVTMKSGSDIPFSRGWTLITVGCLTCFIFGSVYINPIKYHYYKKINSSRFDDIHVPVRMNLFSTHPIFANSWKKHFDLSVDFFFIYLEATVMTITWVWDVSG